MEIKTEQGVTPLDLRVSLTLNPEDYKHAYQAELRRHQKEYVMPGFRPGRVPLSLVEKTLGKQIFQRVIRNLLIQTLNNYLKEQNLDDRLADTPHLLKLHFDPEDETPWKSFPKIEAQFIVGLEPDLALVEIHRVQDLSISVPSEIEVDDDTIQKKIDELRKEYGQLIPINTPQNAEGIRLRFTLNTPDSEAQAYPTNDSKDAYIPFSALEHLFSQELAEKLQRSSPGEMFPILGGRDFLPPTTNTNRQKDAFTKYLPNFPIPYEQVRNHLSATILVRGWFQKQPVPSEQLLDILRKHYNTQFESLEDARLYIRNKERQQARRILEYLIAASIMEYLTSIQVLTYPREFLTAVAKDEALDHIHDHVEREFVSTATSREDLKKELQAFIGNFLSESIHQRIYEFRERIFHKFLLFHIMRDMQQQQAKNQEEKTETEQQAEETQSPASEAIRRQFLQEVIDYTTQLAIELNEWRLKKKSPEEQQHAREILRSLVIHQMSEDKDYLDQMVDEYIRHRAIRLFQKWGWVKDAGPIASSQIEDYIDQLMEFMKKHISQAQALYQTS